MRFPSTRIFGAAVMIAALAAPAAVRAECSFDSVGRPTKFRSSLVRAFAPCPAPYRNGSETQTSGGIPACAPVIAERTESCRFVCTGPPGGPCVPEVVCGYDYDPATTYSFGVDPRSGCDVEVRWDVAPDCRALDPTSEPPLPDVPCQTAFVKARCRGIVRDEDQTPINAFDDPGWSLRLLLRLTTDDPSNGPMTVIDLPLSMPLEVARPGELQLSDNITRLLNDVHGSEVAVFPACTQMQLVDVAVKDPDLAAFATIGIGTAR